MRDFLADAESWADLFCGREFDSKARTEKYDGDGSPWLLVKTLPITAISACSITDEAGTVTALTPSTDLAYEAASGIIKFGPNNVSDFAYFPKSHPGNVSITYTGGYTTIPDDVQEAIALRALAMFAASGLYLNAGLGSENIGGAVSTRIAQAEIDAMIARAEMMLYRYCPMEAV